MKAIILSFAYSIGEVSASRKIFSILFLLCLFISTNAQVTVPGFTVSSAVFEPTGAGAVAFSDVDGDGDQDVIVTGRNSSLLRVAILYVNDGNGNYSEVLGTPFTGVNQGATAFSDIDGDGDFDVLITGYDGASRIAKLYSNDGLGNFTEVLGTPFLGTGRSAIAFSDVDGDGDEDVFISGRNNLNNYSSSLYLNDGNGNFTADTGTPFVGTYYGSVNFSDIDGDGDNDLLMTGEDGTSYLANLYTNNGSGVFTEVSGTNLVGVTESSTEFSDVDGDGDEDVLITGLDSSSNKTSKLYLNDGTGVFIEVLGNSFDNISRGCIMFSDIDLDGDSDVIITGAADSELIAKLYLNDGTGNYTEFTPSPFSGVGASHMAIADVNGDGIPDVWIGGREEDATRVATLYISCGLSFTCADPLFAFCLDDLPPASENDVIINYSCGDATVTWEEEMTSDGCNISVTRVYTVTDDNNSGTCTINNGAQDSEPPVISGPNQLEAFCQDISEIYVDVEDLCGLDGEYTIDYSDELASGGCAGQLIRTYIATDFCGNSSLPFIQIIDLVDNQAPEIICPLDITHECGEEIDYGTPEANDSCSGLSFNFVDETSGDDCETIITRTWTVMDDCGNANSCVQMITILDTTAPILENPPLDYSVQCIDDVLPAENLSGFDACFGSILATPNETIVEGDCGSNATITRVWSFFDLCGNQLEVTQQITVFDNTPPAILIQPEQIILDCTDDIPPADNFMALDNCSGLIDGILTVTTDEGDCAGNLVITRTWEFIDDCGNTSTAVQGVTIQDNEPPILSCPENETYLSSSTPDFESAIAIDNCSANVSLTYSDETENMGCESTITRTWIATDECGNSSSCEQIITILDDSLPVITCPADTTYSCLDDVLPSMATAEDGCGAVEVEVLDAEIDPTNAPCSYIIIRRWRASNGFGEVECEQTITVNDNEAPVIVCPEPLLIGPDDAVVFEEVIATDNCGGTVIITFEDSETPIDCGVEYTRTWTAEDGCNNSSQCSQTITQDNGFALPVITCPADTTYSCLDDVLPSMATAEDGCGVIEVEVLDAEIDPTNAPCSYIIIRRWRASNDFGEVECEQTITVDDTVAPVLMCPADVTYECGSMSSNGMAVAVDNCSEAIIPIYTDEIETENCVTTITRTWSATDDCGNSAECTQIITITDNTPPSIEIGPNVTIECGEPVPPPFAEVADECGEASWTVSIFGEPTCANSYMEIREYIAIDDCGNESEPVFQVVNVVDTTLPEIECPDDIVLNCGDEIPVTEPTYFDECSDVNLTMEDTTEEIDCNTIITRTWTATDGCGNMAACTQTISIIDNSAPELIGLPDEEITLQCNDEVPEAPEVTAMDDCDDNLNVMFEEEFLENEFAMGAEETCNGEQPQDAEASWAMLMFDLPGAENGESYYNVVSSQVLFYEDTGNGLEAELTGTFYCQDNPDAGWYVSIPLTSGVDWDTWSADPDNDYKDDYNLAGDSYLDWTYYLINSNGAFMEGWGDFEGSYLEISHAPSSGSIGWQHGEAANNVGPNNGLGGWFFYDGQFVDSSNQINQEVSGAGDIALDLVCCEFYVLKRTWTVTDCSGNTTMFTQTITVGPDGENEEQLCLGDLNGDNMVTSADLTIFFGDYGCADGDCVADLNGDGQTTSADLTLLISNYGQTCE